MDKKEIVIINGFPNTHRKIKILEEQITHLKSLGLPILMVSGCDVPLHISNLLDYLIINKENEILGPDYQHHLSVLGLRGDFQWITLKEHYVKLFASNVNSTITKNIKLAFNTAHQLGYTSVFYTEDDNIFKSEAIDWVRTNLNRLSEYDLISVSGELHAVDYGMLFTTFFFTNLEFFIPRFNIPSSSKDWWDIENIKKYSLDTVYEGIFVNLFKNDFSKIFSPRNEFDDLASKQLIGWNLCNRYQNEDFVLNTNFTVVPDTNGNKFLILYNFSKYLIDGPKYYSMDIYFDNQFIGTPHLPVHDSYYYIPISNDIVEIKLDIHGYGEKILKTSLEDIKYNGLAIPFEYV